MEAACFLLGDHLETLFQRKCSATSLRVVGSVWFGFLFSFLRNISFFKICVKECVSFLLIKMLRVFTQGFITSSFCAERELQITAAKSAIMFKVWKNTNTAKFTSSTNGPGTQHLVK